MTVNPFWFGVLMTIVAEIVLCIVIVLIGRNSEQKETDEELDMAILEIAQYAKEKKLEEEKAKKGVKTTVSKVDRESD